jgi:cytoskeletal protein CcmA (bactofilin family)
MLNFNRNERTGDARPNDVKGIGKPSMTLNPQPMGSSSSSVGRYAPGSVTTTTPAPAAMPAPAPQVHDAHEASAAAPASGSKLIVGRNVKLKGVEISDCEMVVVEGQVEASVAAKGMQIAKPGTLKGTAVIDVAEIDGDFSGELTARVKLVVNGTGRVSGTIRYGLLIVAEGGEVVGDVKRLEDAPAPAHRNPPDARHSPLHTPNR